MPKKKEILRRDYRGLDVPTVDGAAYFPGYGSKGEGATLQEQMERKHLELFTKVPVVDEGGQGADGRLYLSTSHSVETQWKLEAFNKQLNEALDLELWTYLKDGDGRSFTSFKVYAIYPQPWGLGMGATFDLQMQMLRTYVPTSSWCDGRRTEHQTCAADRIELAVRDGREGSHEFWGNQHTEVGEPTAGGGISSTPEQDVAKERDEEKMRAIARAPVNIRHLYHQSLVSKELAGKFGPYVPAKPSEAQQERGDAAAAAAQDVERWVDANPVPFGKKDLNAYKARLKAVCEERLSIGGTHVKVSLKDANTAAELLIRRADRAFLSELVALLSSRL